MRRRTAIAAAALLAAGLAGCGTAPARRTDRPDDPEGDPAMPSSPERRAYGDDPAQFLELTRPATPSRGVVAVIHGGFWKSGYDLSLGRPLAVDLAGRGWTVANLEYRRVGAGGGWPATFDDVAAALDSLADVEGLDTSTVVTLGHSAGGHLATWAAARGRVARWQPERVAVTHVVSQAGVLDLGEAAALRLGDGAVAALLGPTPPAYDLVDPLSQVPLDVPVWCVHGTGDDIVPISQSRAYVDRARAAGARAQVVETDGDHFVVIDTGSPAWARTVELLESL